MKLSVHRVCNYLVHRFVRAPRGGGKPVPEAAMDAEYASGRWDSFFGSDETPRYETLVRLIRMIAPHPRLLDVGCGNGRLPTMFAPGELPAYLGLDLSREGLRRAESLKLPGARFVHADFEEWRPGFGAWDVIVFNESIGYARDPAQVAQAYAASLPADGSLIVSIFRYGNWRQQWFRIEQVFEVAHAETVTNVQGKTWDLRVLKLRS